MNGGLSFVEYNAIQIEFLPFELDENLENAIFTSQNAVEAVFTKNPEIRFGRCFCVGEKTRALLENYGQIVFKTTEYAAELSKFLIENHVGAVFQFFCGNIRSDEIPSKLTENKIHFKEITVYKTTLNPKKFERNFEAAMFFSPSGVRSYFHLNSPNSVKNAICIGTTTAAELQNYLHMEKVKIANSTTIESVIAKTINSLKNNN